MQKHVNLVDLVKSFPTNIFLQNLASIQKRTSTIKFAHLAEKSGKSSISNLSTKLQARPRLLLLLLRLHERLVVVPAAPLVLDAVPDPELPALVRVRVRDRQVLRKRMNKRMNKQMNSPPNFERLVLGCIEAD